MLPCYQYNINTVISQINLKLTSYHKSNYNLLMVRPKSEVKRQQLGARVDVNIIKKLKHIAIDKNVSFNVLIEEALEDFLKKYKQK